MAKKKNEFIVEVRITAKNGDSQKFVEIVGKTKGPSAHPAVESETHAERLAAADKDVRRLVNEMLSLARHELGCRCG